MNKLVVELAKDYTLDKSSFAAKMSQIDLESAKMIISDLLDMNLTDPNFSSLAETIPLEIGGYNSHDIKHGYDGFIGESYDIADEYVEQKPQKTSNTDKKLNGGGSFADYTLVRLSKDKSHGDKLKLMISGFVNGELIYVYKVPHNHSTFIDHIEGRTNQLISDGKRVLPSFSYKNYEDCDDIELVFRRPDISNYVDYMGKPFYDFVNKL